MGEVFLADDIQLRRKVAIKFLTEALEDDPKARERLHREARSAAALDHPFICKIHEIADIDGRTGIVMEHVPGETLQALLRRSPPTAARALEIAGEIVEALDEAHRRRIIHRDLKPSNVMLAESGHVKVMDFGLAKPVAVDEVGVTQAETEGPLTGSGVRIGTPGYMAPEQLLMVSVFARTPVLRYQWMQAGASGSGNRAASALRRPRLWRPLESDRLPLAHDVLLVAAGSTGRDGGSASRARSPDRAAWPHQRQVGARLPPAVRWCDYRRGPGHG